VTGSTFSANTANRGGDAALKLQAVLGGACSSAIPQPRVALPAGYISQAPRRSGWSTRCLRETPPWIPEGRPFTCQTQDRSASSTPRLRRRSHRAPGQSSC
jgi:hypothetical protein